MKWWAPQTFQETKGFRGREGIIALYSKFYRYGTFAIVKTLEDTEFAAPTGRTWGSFPLDSRGSVSITGFLTYKWTRKADVIVVTHVILPPPVFPSTGLHVLNQGPTRGTEP